MGIRVYPHRDVDYTEPYLGLCPLPAVCTLCYQGSQTQKPNFDTPNN